MPVTYTNRKGQIYMLYRGQTKTGKPRYSFGRMGQSQGELVTELPAGFTISESVNGVVSLVKDRPSLLMPMEVAAVEEAVKQHPRAIASNLGDRLYKPCYSKPNFQALPYRCPLQAALKFRCDCPVSLASPANLMHLRSSVLDYLDS